ncbi:T9SS type A sorting domain-containing protein [Aquimarina hainanensis]|uniref:T9SS type A sorting domain-containing protein n=1 Tax=Aquimarina hainanensis TaxID=1578017 RepID=A0ABW5N7H8_9FLAO|nr:T9SS type A sorting domain-containing protein [Aquimarina sp. TRL1]QKX05235.1 T9SS type A sorting domain-containing protein [Aquimarina sp. TRL1]
MKLLFKNALAFICMLMNISAPAQEVLSTQGNTYTNDLIHLDFTIGELVTQTLSDGANEVTQGFHQTNWNLVDQEDFGSNLEIVLFPNPINDELNIHMKVYKNVTYSIYDALGKRVLHSALFTEKTFIDTGHLSAGFYSILLMTGEEKLKTFKLVKVH